MRPEISMRLPAFIVLVANAACDGGPFGPDFQLITPPCDHPAALLGTWDPRAPAFIIEFKPNTPARAEVDRLASKYHFSARHVYESLPGFSAELNSFSVAAMRCESSINFIEHDGVGERAE